jgi:hypothetical protein
MPGTEQLNIVLAMIALRFETPTGNNLCRQQWVKLPSPFNKLLCYLRI